MKMNEKKKIPPSRAHHQQGFNKWACAALHFIGSSIYMVPFFPLFFDFVIPIPVVNSYFADLSTHSEN